MAGKCRSEASPAKVRNHDHHQHDDKQPNDCNLTIEGHQVEASQSVRYLGLQIDSKLKFSEHVRLVAAKASKVAQNLAKIMPNISATKTRKRKLVESVVHSVLLYEAPIWSSDMSASGWAALLKVQRRIGLRVASASCTVSGDMVGVITSTAPLDILAKARRDAHESKRNPEPRTNAKWHSRMARQVGQKLKKKIDLHSH